MKLSFSIIFTMIINLICTSVFLTILNDSGMFQGNFITNNLEKSPISQIISSVVFCISFIILLFKLPNKLYLTDVYTSFFNIFVFILLFCACLFDLNLNDYKGRLTLCVCCCIMLVYFYFLTFHSWGGEPSRFSKAFSKIEQEKYKNEEKNNIEPFRLIK